MGFCIECAAPLERAIPEGDDRLRDVCTACGYVHYVNPKIVTGCILMHEDRVLLCRRAIEPASGKWTFPAGFLEVEESQAEGAKRETWEESGVNVEVTAPHAFLDIPHISQTYTVFRGNLIDSSGTPGHETSEIAYFALDEIPWEEISFPVVAMALRLFVDDEQNDRQCVHTGVMRWRGTGSRYDVREYDLKRHVALEVRRPGD